MVGQNIYRVSFYNGNRLLEEESITIYHDTDGNNLEKLKTEWEQKNAPEPAPVVVPSNLDSKKLYNRAGKPLSFRIIVQKNTPYLSALSEQVSQKLQDF